MLLAASHAPAEARDLLSKLFTHAEKHGANGVEVPRFTFDVLWHMSRGETYAAAIMIASYDGRCSDYGDTPRIEMSREDGRRLHVVPHDEDDNAVYASNITVER